MFSSGKKAFTEAILSGGMPVEESEATAEVAEIGYFRCQAVP